MKKVGSLLPLLLLVAFGGVLGVFAQSADYTVERGDTLSQIARDHGIDLDTLIEHNPQIRNPHRIFPGEIVNIPDPDDSVDTASVTAQNGTPYRVSQAEKDLLARIIYAEARGESYEGKLAVGHVVLNRVDSDQFPDSIRDVIYQRGQFQPVTNGAIQQRPDNDSIRAAEEALANWGDNRGSLYFYNPRTSTSQWIFTRERVKTIGNHVFAR